MTVAIIVIVVVVIAIIAAVVLSPRARREAKLRGERAEAASHHREVADKRETEADAAEREAVDARERAERAEARADKRRSVAESHEERANLHDDGKLDHELEHGPDEPAPDAPRVAEDPADRPADTAPARDERQVADMPRADEPGRTSEPPGTERTRITDDVRDRN